MVCSDSAPMCGAVIGIQGLRGSVVFVQEGVGEYGWFLSIPDKV